MPWDYAGVGIESRCGQDWFFMAANQRELNEPEGVLGSAMRKTTYIQNLERFNRKQRICSATFTLLFFSLLLYIVTHPLVLPGTSGIIAIALMGIVGLLVIEFFGTRSVLAAKIECASCGKPLHGVPGQIALETDLCAWCGERAFDIESRRG